MRSARRKSKCPSSTSQPHLHETLSGRVSSPPAGLDRTKSVSGTFFRRTQRTAQRTFISSLGYLFSGRASRAGSKKFQEAQSILLSMKGKIAETMSFGSMENQTTEASSRRVRWAWRFSANILFYFTFLPAGICYSDYWSLKSKLHFTNSICVYREVSSITPVHKNGIRSIQMMKYLVAKRKFHELREELYNCIC